MSDFSEAKPTDIEILKQMIQEKAKLSLETQYDRPIVILREPPPANYQVTIREMPTEEQVIIIKTDEFQSPKTIFKGEKGECKRADFVIIANMDKTKVILCIEMKAGKGESEEHIIQQLTGAQCFIGYCKEIGRLFWKKKDFLENYHFRFVSIRNIRISKKPTRDQKKTTHNQPDKMLKINSPNYLLFNQLIGMPA